MYWNLFTACIKLYTTTQTHTFEWVASNSANETSMNQSPTNLNCWNLCGFICRVFWILLRRIYCRHWWKGMFLMSSYGVLSCILLLPSSHFLMLPNPRTEVWGAWLQCDIFEVRWISWVREAFWHCKSLQFGSYNWCAASHDTWWATLLMPLKHCLMFFSWHMVKNTCEALSFNPLASIAAW